MPRKKPTLNFDELSWPEPEHEISALLRRVDADGSDHTLDCLIWLPAQGAHRSQPFKVIKAARHDDGRLVGEALFTLTGAFSTLAYEDRWRHPLRQVCESLLARYKPDIHNPRIEMPDGSCEFALVDPAGRYWVRTGRCAVWSLVQHPVVVPPGEVLGPDFRRIKPLTGATPCRSTK